jgi:hypothetical protein
MGRLSYRFTLNNRDLYFPEIDFWQSRIKEQTGLDLHLEKYVNVVGKEESIVYFFSHSLLSDKIAFRKVFGKNEMKIITSYHELNYLYNALIYMVVMVTLEMGGGRMYFLDDKLEHARITEKNLHKVFNYGWLTIQDMEWAKQPYEIAKNMPGFRS